MLQYVSSDWIESGATACRELRHQEVTLDKLLLIEWSELIIPTHSLAEIVLRGTIMYLSLFATLRFVMLRQSSTIGIAEDGEGGSHSRKEDDRVRSHLIVPADM